MVAVTKHDLECGELLLPGDEIPADPADAAGHCAAADEALHCRGFIRTGPWREMANGDWMAKIEADWGGRPMA